MPSLATAPAPSPWRYVRARVHVSLTPQELSDAEAHAARHAHRGLLLRHHAALDGVAVAHATQFRLDGPPRLIGASPFAHVAATTTLLVFAPPPGTRLTGVVQHVGPDHVGLAVHAVFHAVLPLTGLSDRFRYLAPDRWRALDATDDGADGADRDVAVGTRIRFAVAAVKPTTSGLFQMIATLDGDAALGPLDPDDAARLAQAEADVAGPDAVANGPAAPDGATVDIELDGAARRRAWRRASGTDMLGASPLPTPLAVGLGSASMTRPARASSLPTGASQDEPSQNLTQSQDLSQSHSLSQGVAQTPRKGETPRKKRRRASDSGDESTKKKRKEKRGKKRSRESGGGLGSSLADAISRGLAGRRRRSEL